MSNDTSVLLIAWRRPRTTKQVIDAIRIAAPSRMFVACDGPNPERIEEAEKVAATRALIENEINWPCTIRTLYSEVNQGCRLGVSRAIDWFFNQVEEGIILEDDCVPHPDFFPYCEELLRRYREDERIWCISGNNFQDGQTRGNSSYYFSNYNHCWGWASWRRCWNQYDKDLSQWPALNNSGFLKVIFDNPRERMYWKKVWDRLYYDGQPDTWDFQWTFTCLANRGLTALPNVNLVSNIGCGNESTHCNIPLDPIPTKTLGSVITHPAFIQRDLKADSYFVQQHLIPYPAMNSRIRNATSRNLHKMRKLAVRVKQRLGLFDDHGCKNSQLITSEGRKLLKNKARYESGVVSTNGGLLHFADACTLLVGEAEIFTDRIYNFKTQREEPIIVDCGANIGLASIWFALNFPRAKIYAYEADPNIFLLLQENVKSLGLEKRVFPFNYAIWRDASGVEFQQEGGFSGQISGHTHELIKNTVRVPSVTLSELLQTLPYVDLLKVDIEGAENMIFHDTIDLSKSDRVFLEYHSHEKDPQLLGEILSALRCNGFRYHIKEANPSKHPFIKIESLLGMDLQLNIFSYR